MVTNQLPAVLQDPPDPRQAVQATDEALELSKGLGKLGDLSGAPVVVAVMVGWWLVGWSTIMVNV